MSRPTLAEAHRAHRVLRAVWVIVSARADDAVAADVARLGEALRNAIDAGDLAAAERALADVRGWLSTMSGVVHARLVAALGE